RTKGLAPSAWAALPSGSDESRKVEDPARTALESSSSPRRTRGRSAGMLGHRRPGSEGNLASDLENQEPLDTGNHAQPPPRDTGAKAPKAESATSSVQ